MGVTDRIDPLAGVPRAEEPVGVLRLYLDHALHRPDRQRAHSGGDELPQVPRGFGHAYEPRLKDRDGDAGGQTPVAEPHHAGPGADRHLVPLPHARLGRLVRHPVAYAQANRDSVRHEGDVEDGEAERGEPERALREPFACERPAHDPRKDVPAQAGGEQRSAADDHQVRVGQVADEMAGVPCAGQPVRGPRQVLDRPCAGLRARGRSRRPRSTSPACGRAGRARRLDKAQCARAARARA